MGGRPTCPSPDEACHFMLRPLQIGGKCGLRPGARRHAELKLNSHGQILEVKLEAEGLWDGLHTLWDQMLHQMQRDLSASSSIILKISLSQLNCFELTS